MDPTGKSRMVMVHRAFARKLDAHALNEKQQVQRVFCKLTCRSKASQAVTYCRVKLAVGSTNRRSLQRPPRSINCPSESNAF
eukprot:1691889-Rhodomonas_salina.4